MDQRHQAIAYDFVRRFAGRALPDAHDLPTSRMRALQADEGWSVDVDIPTSTMPCWLSFHVIETDEGPSALLDLALRSGSGIDSTSVYSWDEDKGAWQLAGNEPEFEGT